MKKYTVQLVFNVKSVDLLDVEVEANSPQEARKLAEEAYFDDEAGYEFYSGESDELELAEGWKHEIIEEEEIV